MMEFVQVGVWGQWSCGCCQSFPTIRKGRLTEVEEGKVGLVFVSVVPTGSCIKWCAAIVRRHRRLWSGPDSPYIGEEHKYYGVLSSPSNFSELGPAQRLRVGCIYALESMLTPLPILVHTWWQSTAQSSEHDPISRG